MYEQSSHTWKSGLLRGGTFLETFQNFWKLSRIFGKFSWNFLPLCNPSENSIDFIRILLNSSKTCLETLTCNCIVLKNISPSSLHLFITVWIQHNFWLMTHKHHITKKFTVLNMNKYIKSINKHKESWHKKTGYWKNEIESTFSRILLQKN